MYHSNSVINRLPFPFHILAPSPSPSSFFHALSSAYTPMKSLFSGYPSNSDSEQCCYILMSQIQITEKVISVAYKFHTTPVRMLTLKSQRRNCNQWFSQPIWCHRGHKPSRASISEIKFWFNLAHQQTKHVYWNWVQSGQKTWGVAFTWNSILMGHEFCYG